MKKLVIIVPCYNEEEVLHWSAEQLRNTLLDLIEKQKISGESGILFVNDGSRDKTWEIITELVKSDRCFMGIQLAANSGHQNALLAGIESTVTDFDISITIDADLQDDIDAMEQMVDKFNNEGCDVVYGVRSGRKTDSFFKRFTAQSFYKLMSLMGVKTVYNHADYRLMSKRAMEALLKFKERNIFLRGIVPKIGYKSDSVYYERKKRTAGTSKYPLKKMLAFAWDGITSFSTKPISFIMGMGVLVTFAALLAFIYILISYVTGNAEQGWTSILASIWLLGGMQLFAIGVIGQYIGKTYIETKERPRYTIQEFIKHDD